MKAIADKCLFSALLFVGCLTATVPAFSQTTASSKQVGEVAGVQAGARWMLVFKTTSGTRRVTGRHIELGFEPVRTVSPNTQVIKAASDLSPEALSAALASLRADPQVLAVEPDDLVQHHAALPPNDPGFSDLQYTSAQPVGQWYLKPNAGAVKSAINARDAWSFSQGDAAVVIAVLDTGVLFDHPDLQRRTAGGRLLPGYDFVSADSDGGFVRANDGDGWDNDPSDPGDWIDEALLSSHPAALSGCTTGKSSWHGTRTAGLIGALSQNGAGIAGVDWRASLLPVRVLGRCGGYTSDIVAGIRWAAGLHLAGVPDNPNPARVISMSLGRAGACSFSEQAAIDEVVARGVVVVASAGNKQGPVESPANCRGVIAVAGLRHVGTKVGFSSMGAEVAISAPAGNCINVQAQQPCLYSIDTTTNSGTTVPERHSFTNQFDSNVGTSFAAPQVAGVAGLLLALNGKLTPAQVRSAVQESAETFPLEVDLPTCPAVSTVTDKVGQCNCTTSQCGAGMLNAFAAVNRVNPAQCLFSWAERTFPSRFNGSPAARTQDIYQYRYYPTSLSYLGIAADNGHLFYLDTSGLVDLGNRSEWFAWAGCL